METPTSGTIYTQAEETMTTEVEVTDEANNERQEPQMNTDSHR